LDIFSSRSLCDMRIRKRRRIHEKFIGLWVEGACVLCALQGSSAEGSVARPARVVVADKLQGPFVHKRGDAVLGVLRSRGCRVGICEYYSISISIYCRISTLFDACVCVRVRVRV